MTYGTFDPSQLQVFGYAAAPTVRLFPYQSDPIAAAYANGQLAPAGWFGNLISGLAPTIGRAVGGNAGQAISTIGGLGRYLPFDVDPVTAAYAHGQLAPAGWFGNLISGIAPTIGRAVGGNAGRRSPRSAASAGTCRSMSIRSRPRMQPGSWHRRAGSAI